ncbi:unnamed protein product [Brugia timori]|uniref:Secreted protein n=1 Tax=Brugia timori TaxID=42155 RepID=A0A0R3QWN2_9BILA|nr:unnamed protein product [Brugia timori]
MKFTYIVDVFSANIHSTSECTHSIELFANTAKRLCNLNEKLRKQTFKCYTFTSRTETESSSGTWLYSGAFYSEIMQM